MKYSAIAQLEELGFTPVPKDQTYPEPIEIIVDEVEQLVSVWFWIDTVQFVKTYPIEELNAEQTKADMRQAFAIAEAHEHQQEIPGLLYEVSAL
jgi:hypothetical protein